MKDERLTLSASLWLALFPIAFVIHFAEELLAGEGYSAYLLRLHGIVLFPARFIALQAFGFLLIIAGCLIAARLKFPDFMIALLGGLFLCNGLSHSITALWFGGYGPGLYSSLVLWIPIGVLSLVRSYKYLSNKRLMAATLIGFAINGMVAVITMRGGRLF